MELFKKTCGLEAELDNTGLGIAVLRGGPKSSWTRLYAPVHRRRVAWSVRARDVKLNGFGLRRSHSDVERCCQLDPGTGAAFGGPHRYLLHGLAAAGSVHRDRSSR